MIDDAFRVFVILACILALAIPEPAQVLFVMFAGALAVTAWLVPDTGYPDGHRRRDRYNVAGR